MPRTLADRDVRGAVKVDADADTGRLLGLHAMAGGVWETTLAATYAIKPE